MNNYYDEPLKEINFKNTKISTYGNYAKNKTLRRVPATETVLKYYFHCDLVILIL